MRSNQLSYPAIGLRLAEKRCKSRDFFLSLQLYGRFFLKNVRFVGQMFGNMGLFDYFCASNREKTHYYAENTPGISVEKQVSLHDMGHGGHSRRLGGLDGRPS